MARRDELAETLAAGRGSGDAVKLRKGEVTAVDASTGTVSLTLGGSTTVLTGIHHLDTYNPSAGDVVMILRAGPDLLVLGAVEPPQ